MPLMSKYDVTYLPGIYHAYHDTGIYCTSVLAQAQAPTNGLLSRPVRTPEGMACLAQYENPAGAFTCGARVQWLVDTEAMAVRTAQHQVGTEFPLECGACLFSPPPLPPSPPPPSPPPSSPSPPSVPLSPHEGRGDLDGLTEAQCRDSFVTAGPDGGRQTEVGCTALAAVMERTLRDGTGQAPASCTRAITAFDSVETCNAYFSAIVVYCEALFACWQAPRSPPPSLMPPPLPSAPPPGAPVARFPPRAPPGHVPGHHNHTDSSSDATLLAGAPDPPVDPPGVPPPPPTPQPPFAPLGLGEAVARLRARIVVLRLTLAADVSSIDAAALRGRLVTQLPCAPPACVLTLTIVGGSVNALVEATIPEAEAASAAAVEAGARAMAETAPSELSVALGTPVEAAAMVSVATQELAVRVAPPPPRAPPQFPPPPALPPSPTAPPPTTPPPCAPPVPPPPASPPSTPSPPLTPSPRASPAPLSPLYPLGARPNAGGGGGGSFIDGLLLGLGGLAACVLALAALVATLVRPLAGRWRRKAAVQPVSVTAKAGAVRPSRRTEPAESAELRDQPLMGDAARPAPSDERPSHGDGPATDATSSHRTAAASHRTPSTAAAQAPRAAAEPAAGEPPTAAAANPTAATAPAVLPSPHVHPAAVLAPASPSGRKRLPPLRGAAEVPAATLQQDHGPLNAVTKPLG